MTQENQQVGLCIGRLARVRVAARQHFAQRSFSYITKAACRVRVSGSILHIALPNQAVCSKSSCLQRSSHSTAGDSWFCKTTTCAGQQLGNSWARRMRLRAFFAKVQILLRHHYLLRHYYAAVYYRPQDSSPLIILSAPVKISAEIGK